MEAFYALAILVMVLGGLLAYEAMCTYADNKRYRRWVNDREQILAQLERESSSEETQDE